MGNPGFLLLTDCPVNGEYGGRYLVGNNAAEWNEEVFSDELRFNLSIHDYSARMQHYGKHLNPVFLKLHVMSSRFVLLKTHRAEKKPEVHVKYVEAHSSSHWCGVEVRRERCQLKCRPLLLTMIQNYVPKGPRLAELCDVNIHLLT
ncbi:hypothetical protein TNCV_4650291 [Trichonephila clavipes]|nr:hypothetical protein TNCV_4650291 [Trichonephila clavipes]